MRGRADRVRAQLAASALDDLRTEDCMYFLMAVGNLGFNMGHIVTYRVLVRLNTTLPYPYPALCESRSQPGRVSGWGPAHVRVTRARGRRGALRQAGPQTVAVAHTTHDVRLVTRPLARTGCGHLWVGRFCSPRRGLRPPAHRAGKRPRGRRVAAAAGPARSAARAGAPPAAGGGGRRPAQRLCGGRAVTLVALKR